VTVPVNVFGRRGDVGTLAYQLVGALDEATVEGDGRTSARVRGRVPGVSSGVLAVDVSTDHLGGAGGDGQRSGMVGWLSRPDLDGPGRAAVLALVPELRTSLSFHLAPSTDQATVDAVVELAVRCAGWADGFVLALASGVVLGPDGSVWLEPVVDVDGAVAGPTPRPADASDPGDELDPFVREARQVLATEGLVGTGVVLDSTIDAQVPSDPPEQGRVARRLVVTAAVAARALNEADGEHLVEARDALLDWVEGTGAAVELEPWEATVLAAPPAGIAERDLVDGSWRTEAAAVLAWALGLLDLLPADELAEPGTVFAAIGLASPADTAALLDGSVLRDADEIEHLRRQLLTVHWRLTEQRLRPGPLDLADVAAGHTWGPLTVDGLALAEGDLTVGGRPLVDADPDRVRLATSIALERHRAVNWLVDGGGFGGTDVST